MSKTISFILPLTVLWDLYIPSVGVRVIDVAALLVIFISIFINPRVRMRSVIRVLFVSILLFLLFFLNGGDEKSLFGLLMLCLFIFVGDLDYLSVRRVLVFIIYVNFVLVILQITYFQYSGNILHLYSFLGHETRGLSSVFRPAGLYLEPSSMSLAIFMSSVCTFLINRKLGVEHFVAGVSIVLSASMWGIVAISISIIGFVMFYRQRLVVGVLFIAFIPLIISMTPWIEYFLARIDGLSSDASFAVRYVFPEVETRSILIGNGFYRGSLIYGMSGLSAVASFFGLVGTLLLLFTFISSKVNLQYFSFKLVSLGLVLLAAPLVTYLFFYVYLKILLKE